MIETLLTNGYQRNAILTPTPDNNHDTESTPQKLVQPIYITVETGGTLTIQEESGRQRLSLLSKTAPYPYGTHVDVRLTQGPDDETQWVPMRAINHKTDRFGQLWIKVEYGYEEPDKKFYVQSQFVRKREFETRDTAMGVDVTHFPVGS